MAQNPGLPIPDVSKIIGEQWRRLSAEAKEEWNSLAEEEKARHQQQYPGYRYQPRRNAKAGNQSSVSGPSTSEPQEPCSRCGGKPMSYYNNPSPIYTPPASAAQQAVAMQVPAKRSYVVSNTPVQRLPPTSPEHRAQQKAFVEAHPYQQVDPRLIYAIPANQPLPTPPSSDSQDAKRRRFNSTGVYMPGRETYPETAYAYAHSPVLNGPYSRPEVVHVQHIQQGAKPVIVSPPRAVYPRPPQLQPVRPPHPHQRNRSSVALPPIETMVSQSPIKSSSVHSQGSGVEAMIMSIPVLNKIKVLSQISSPLPVPGPMSPKPEVRGAIIAVEGMDRTTVNSMIDSPAEQLEKEGKFSVRIFGGPDPFAAIESARNDSNVHGRHMTTEVYLSMLSEWHKINKEMVEYISTRPGSSELKGNRGYGSKSSSSDVDHHMADADGPTTPEKAVRIYQGKSDGINDSAISPKTMDKAAELSIISPPGKGRSQSTSEYSIRPPPLTFPRPHNSTRIPPPPPTPPPASPPPPPPSTSKPSSRIPPPRNPQGTPGSALLNPKTQEGPSLPRPCTNAIPIVLVPHFQLTTIDASSIAMPISDGFSPPAHWQWFATLWRGSIGPDITIVIKGVDDEVDGGEAARASVSVPTNTPMLGRDRTSSAGLTAPGGQSGVDIRLNDCRAVIVKTSIIGMSATSKGPADAERNPGDKTLKEAGSAVPVNAAYQAKEMENWEKAKRRVGFEVEEFLRR
ncbi:slightly ste11-like protein [Exophiala xenobiotica]|nr:slightly ste11-like protein [Exophiala xenobiotica]KAK5339659.1 slightly ste11-like protein [Exophiala xenobiotica]